MINQTPRDQKLMALLAHYGMLSTQQIGTLLFKGIRTTTLLRRLRRLEAENIIRRVQALPNSGNVWLLTRRGETKLGFEDTSPAVNRNTIIHDLTVIDIRIALEKLGLGDNWIPERSLKQTLYTHRERQNENLNFIPDAIFSAQMDKTRAVALEVELSPKSITRYEKIFQRYVKQKHISFIWYLVANESFGKSLLSKWKYSTPPTDQDYIAVSQISEIKTNARSARVQFMDWDTTVDDLFKLSEPAHTPDHAMSTPNTEEN